MKKNYKHPTAKFVRLDMESVMLSGSNPDEPRNIYDEEVPDTQPEITDFPDGWEGWGGQW